MDRMQMITCVNHMIMELDTILHGFVSYDYHILSIVHVVLLYNYCVRDEYCYFLLF